jgi:hypothetical protein
MDWTITFTDPGELRQAFPGRPDARYRPLTAWWWSGEPVTEERMLWQLDRIAAVGCGGFDITGLAMHGPSAGSRADDPLGGSPEWYRLKKLAFQRARDLGLGVATWSPMQFGKPVDAPKVMIERPDLRGELVRVRDDGPHVVPFGLDYGNPDTIAALTAPDTETGRFIEEFGEFWGDPIVAIFEDEFPAFPRWAPDFADGFRAANGFDLPLEVFERDLGPRTPALRVAAYEHAVQRIRRGYTAWQTEFVDGHGLLAGYDQMSRRGTPFLSSVYYLDPFRTMTWANAPGTDQMGDARFHLSLADLAGSPRVWLEGFHSHGHGLSLSDQMRLINEWSREGISLYLPHGGYYATRALWWEWAPPENVWQAPNARHYAAFADTVGRLLSCVSAGRHVPEIAVLYPLRTVWADMTGHLQLGPHGMAAESTYIDVFGLHAVPSGWDLERFERPSVLADAGYDRVAVDEEHVDFWPVPVVVPASLCLRTDTVERLIAHAERGHAVVVVEPVPEWSAENGRDDETFRALVERLLEVAVVVASAADVPAALPTPRVRGAKAQWRRVGDLDLVFLTGTGVARLAGMAARAPERWDPRTGEITPFPARADGDDLLVRLDDPATLLTLPIGAPTPPRHQRYDVVELPEVWECDYVPWGENRWGDYRLPANEGTPPTERRTFAFREGDDAPWQAAPVVPEDVQQPVFELGFEDRMAGNYGRVRPEERLLPDGWREVVSTYGPKAVLDGGRLVEYSERLGVEDLVLATPIGLKGHVERVKADLGEGGGTLTSWCHVPQTVDQTADQTVDTHLVVEGGGVYTVRLDGELLIGPVEGGLLTVPVQLTAGWHELELAITHRGPSRSRLSGYRPAPRTKVGWAFTEPYQRAPIGIWGGIVLHPDYKGSPGTKRFRRRVVVPEQAKVVSSFTASGDVTCALPDVLEPGEHVIEVTVGPSVCQFGLSGVVELTMPSGTVSLRTDERWEIADDDVDWSGAFEIGAAGAISFGTDDAPDPYESGRHLLTDVAWLEGESVLDGQVPQLWADAPEPPPPAWFCFTAAPGARSMTVPIEGTVDAWVGGEPTPVDGGVLPLREGARVALRVQAPAGRRGAACFREHPVLELGPGHVRTGLSWHRQGLDCFAGVIRHRTTVDVADGGPAILDLGEVSGSVEVQVNGESAGVLFSAPWSLPVQLQPGVNTVEIDVASTLGPLAGRGIPTPFGPEDQRITGILGRPQLRLPRP